MKIQICVPCMDQVPALFARSLAMIQKPDGVDVSLAFEMSSLIYTARNNLALKSIQQEADFTLWLDSDMVFPPDILIRLLETQKETGADIVTGVYYRRKGSYAPVLFNRLDINEDSQTAKFTEFQEIPDKPFEIGGCGFGAVLVSTGALMDVSAKYGNLFAPIGNNGEDVSFCWRARMCGNNIIADPRIPIGHVGQTVITKEFYEAIRGENK